MVIENKKVVTVNYNLSVPDKANGGETLVEKTDNDNPFVFLYGSGGLLEEFENNLKGKQPGDKFDFTIKSENGYGVRDDDHIVNIPIEAFQAEDGSTDDEALVVGNILPMVDNTGHKLEGVVEEVTDTYVRMDFNHPLAGQDLHFVGEVTEVREASKEELEHGHVHGPGGHPHH